MAEMIAGIAHAMHWLLVRVRKFEADRAKRAGRA
jgi:hypothetical protein